MYPTDVSELERDRIAREKEKEMQKAKMINATKTPGLAGGVVRERTGRNPDYQSRDHHPSILKKIEESRKAILRSMIKNREQLLEAAKGLDIYEDTANREIIEALEGLLEAEKLSY